MERKDREVTFLNIASAAKRFGKSPDRLRYLLRRAGVRPVTPKPKGLDQRGTYYSLQDIRAIVAS